MASNEDVRLTSQDVTSVLPVTEQRGLTARFTIKFILILIWICICLPISLARLLPQPVYIAFLVVPIVAIVAFRLNGEAFRWFQSEFLDTRWRMSTLQPAFKEGDYEILPERVEPGDYIRRAENATVQNSETTSNESAQQDPIKNNYYRVIATSESQSGRIKIAVFGCDFYDADPSGQSVKYLRRELVHTNKQQSQAMQSTVVARAFEDLINLLFTNPRLRYESDIASQLSSEFHHSPSSIRLAFRIAESGKMIVRQRKKISYAIEMLRPAASVTGHRSCLISLTQSASIWKHATPLDQKGKSRLLVEKESTKAGFGNYVIISTGDRATNIIGNPTWHNEQGSDLGEIIDGLTRLCAELKKHATDPEHDRVIGDLASALIAAREGNGPEMMSNLSKLGSRATALRNWVLDNAKNITIPIIVALIEKACHLPSGG